MVEARELSDGDVRIVAEGLAKLGQVGAGQDLEIPLADDGQHGDRELPQVDARVEGEERAEPRRRHLLDLRLDAAGMLPRASRAAFGNAS